MAYRKDPKKLRENIDCSRYTQTGYDSEELHRQIREEMGVDSVIPVRTWKGKIYSGKYGQEMYNNLGSERYRERNKVETVFSVIKRRFEENLKARKYWYQVKEIKVKMILHNLTKAVQSIVIVIIVEAFQQSRNYITFGTLPPGMGRSIQENADHRYMPPSIQSAIMRETR